MIHAVVDLTVKDCKNILLWYELYFKKKNKPTQSDINSYIKIKADLDGFSEVVNKFFDEGGLGCNVTLPFKQNAFDYVQQSSELAKITGSVNTIYKNEGIFFGDSTDGIGFIADLEKKLTST